MSELSTYFTKDFLEGLYSKSSNFQNKFWSIIEDIDSYFGYDDEDAKKEFYEYFSNSISYTGKGNLLYTESLIVCGDINSGEPFFSKVMTFVEKQFSYFYREDAADAMNDATHIIICVRCPEENVPKNADTWLRILVEELSENTPQVITILNTPEENQTNGCLIAAFK